ncbi:hypothetical protein KSP39_PZI015045 [Platanthera zijinensis]|uniref:Uncharacterized protein n=1 Tax=Platanthera zijinensis TaxID=2320716 RepID=A0AAP0G2I8_9ASPA
MLTSPRMLSQSTSKITLHPTQREGIEVCLKWAAVDGESEGCAQATRSPPPTISKANREMLGGLHLQRQSIHQMLRDEVVARPAISHHHYRGSVKCPPKLHRLWAR